MKKRNLFSYLLSLLGEKKRNKGIQEQLSSESIEDLKSRLKTLMEKEQPFLNQEYHMKDMADDLHIPVYQLSAFINQVMGMHFTDYMNKFRISYCERIMRSGQAVPKNLKELAFQCGFNNRNSFTSAFKKFTGKKPSEYLNHLH